MKKLSKSIITFFLITTCLFSLSAKPNGITKIKKAGTLTVGIKDDVPGFGWLNPETNQYEGLEIDLAKAIAKHILGSESKVTFIPVSAKNRSAYINQERVDMVLATFTVTEERKNSYDFSDIYYTDSVGLMVKKESGITSFKDLLNKKIGVTQGSITSVTIKNAAIKEGVFINCVVYPSNQTLKDALIHNEIDAFCIDTSILHGYMDSSMIILPEHFDEMMYAVAIKKDNAALTKQVNEVIRNLVKTGELEKMIKKHGLK